MLNHRNILSYGGGVNSQALYLFLIDQGVNFEAVFVDHGTDWPATYENLEMFQGWLRKRKLPRITALKPNVQGNSSLYEHCISKTQLPSMMNRWCTDKFKLRPIYKYLNPPAFIILGIDFGESKRAKLSVHKGFENRFPLIENEIDREGCKDIIRSHGLPIPQKSGCYICPFQKLGEWKKLRVEHPDLFCNAERLENASIKLRKSKGQKPIYLCNYRSGGASLRSAIDENQAQLWEDHEYPPCNCGL